MIQVRFVKVHRLADRLMPPEPTRYISQHRVLFPKPPFYIVFRSQCDGCDSRYRILFMIAELHLLNILIKYDKLVCHPAYSNSAASIYQEESTDTYKVTT